MKVHFKLIQLVVKTVDQLGFLKVLPCQVFLPSCSCPLYSVGTVHISSRICCFVFTSLIYYFSCHLQVLFPLQTMVVLLV